LEGVVARMSIVARMSVVARVSVIARSCCKGVSCCKDLLQGCQLLQGFVGRSCRKDVSTLGIMHAGHVRRAGPLCHELCQQCSSMCPRKLKRWCNSRMSSFHRHKIKSGA
jgi:hypothetical protein